jgi:uncharacterized membrane protein
MPNVHPLLVHFPIALIFAAIACDLIGLITRKEEFVFAGTVVTVFAAVGAGATVLSGIFAEESVEHTPEIANLIEKDETLGFIFLAVVVFLVIYRLSLRRNLYGKAGWISLVISVAAAAIVSIGGYYGGKMVYTYGAGVSSRISRPAGEGQSLNHDNSGSGEIEPDDDI